MPSNRSASTVFIFVTLLISILGFGLIIPILPKLVVSLTGKGPSEGAHIYGLLLSCFGLMQFLFSPLLGSLSDRFGRRPVLLISLLVTVVDYIIMALAPNVAWLFVGRVLTGITGASFTVGRAYIIDTSPPEKRAQSFGMLGAAFSIGFILGPAVGGLLGHISPRAPFWAAAALSLVNCIYGAFILPESLAPEHRRPLAWKSIVPVHSLGILARERWVLIMSLGLILTYLAHESLPGTWVLYTTHKFHWTETDNGLSLALVGICSGIVQATLTRTLVPSIGDRRAIMLGMLFAILGYAAYGLAVRSWMLLAAIPIFCLGGLAGPSTSSMLSKAYGPHEQGAVQGALSSIQSLMGIFGPLLATYVFAAFTAPSAPVQFAGASFVLAALLSVVATVLTYAALKMHREAEVEETAPTMAV